MPLWIEVQPGVRVTFEQMMALKQIKDRHGEYKWHLNDCGCCIGVHTAEGSYVVDESGEYDFYEGEEAL